MKNLNCFGQEIFIVTAEQLHSIARAAGYAGFVYAKDTAHVRELAAKNVNLCLPLLQKAEGV